MGDRELVSIGSVDLEVEAFGRGEPLLVISTALTADELLPLTERLAASTDVRAIHYHRRGYAGSAAIGSAAADVPAAAADCLALMSALSFDTAHVVGGSWSAAVALAVAATAPKRVRTLTVIEPPPVHAPSAASFRSANARLVALARERGPHAALDDLMTTLAGPGWREASERDLPASVAAMERDAPVFFAHDLPALSTWRFGTDEAARVTCPVLYVGGSASGAWFDDVRSWVSDLLPHAEVVTVEGAGHLLALTHTEEVAVAVASFVDRQRPPSAGGARDLG